MSQGGPQRRRIAGTDRDGVICMRHILYVHSTGESSLVTSGLLSPIGLKEPEALYISSSAWYFDLSLCLCLSIMDPRAPVPSVTLHLTSLAILSPTNSPLLVHSFTGKQDELRHYHLAHAALDVVEERSRSSHALQIRLRTLCLPQA